MEIETPGLLLRPVRPSDAEDLWALEQDGEVMRFINGGEPTPRDGDDGTDDFLMPRGHEKNVWTAIERSARHFAGWFALTATEAGDAAEIGYRLRRAVWGKGFGTEGTVALLDHGFARLGFTRIFAQTMAVNRASRRVMEKAGLVHVRTFHLDFDDPLPGSEEGEVEYAAMKGTWVRPQS